LTLFMIVFFKKAAFENYGPFSTLTQILDQQRPDSHGRRRFFCSIIWNNACIMHHANRVILRSNADSDC
jgi:hypothetical protein